jgi:hypothetical protein
VDHRLIEEARFPERYLNHALPQQDRADFEAHLVDCAECTDRLLLAEMFHNRNGHKPEASPAPPLPLRARFVAQFTPWEIFLFFAVAALLLVLLPATYMLWKF